MTWVSGNLAVSGIELRIRTDNGKWVEGWFVRYAYLAAHKTAEEVSVGGREYRSHRKRTDI